MGNVSAALVWPHSHDWAHGEQMGTRKNEWGRILPNSVWICYDANFRNKTTTEGPTVNWMTRESPAHSVSFLWKRHNQGFQSGAMWVYFMRKFPVFRFKGYECIKKKNTAGAKLRKPQIP